MSKQRDLGRWPVQVDLTLRAERYNTRYGLDAGDVAAEFAGTCNARAHEITDAIAAAVNNAQAGLNWLQAQPLELEEIREALNSIVNNGKRTCEIVVGLRAHMQKVAAGDGAADPRVDNHDEWGSRCLYEYTLPSSEHWEELAHWFNPAQRAQPTHPARCPPRSTHWRVNAYRAAPRK